MEEATTAGRVATMEAAEPVDTMAQRAATTVAQEVTTVVTALLPLVDTGQVLVLVMVALEAEAMEAAQAAMVAERAATVAPAAMVVQAVALLGTRNIRPESYLGVVPVGTPEYPFSAVAVVASAALS